MGEKTVSSSQGEQKRLEETEVGCFPLTRSVRLWGNPSQLYTCERHCFENVPCLEQNILCTFLNGYILVTLSNFGDSSLPYNFYPLNEELLIFKFLGIFPLRTGRPASKHLTQQTRDQNL